MPEGGYEVLPRGGCALDGGTAHASCRADCCVAICFTEPSYGLPWQLNTAEEAERSQIGRVLQRGSGSEPILVLSSPLSLHSSTLLADLGLGRHGARVPFHRPVIGDIGWKDRQQ
ncbi:hypothetical protein NDU88_002993 [Pleurodeles waltl]|uniref:Uncharacterized protein n=1 Tax=Pleurodeles waltl TaxID=8319 RepID=A0AAV7W0W3_PLEWA|nr:hypothetical protein NDU88_002993 [Pleurodeles waltl]